MCRMGLDHADLVRQEFERVMRLSQQGILDEYVSPGNAGPQRTSALEEALAKAAQAKAERWVLN